MYNVKKYILLQLNYFDEWYKAHINRRKETEDVHKWNKWFLAAPTYLNLRVAFSGFLNYAEYILHKFAYT